MNSLEDDLVLGLVCLALKEMEWFVWEFESHVGVWDGVLVSISVRFSSMA